MEVAGADSSACFVHEARFSVNNVRELQMMPPGNHRQSPIINHRPVIRLANSASKEDIAAISALHTACLPRGWGREAVAALLAPGGVFALLASRPRDSMHKLRGRKDTSHTNLCHVYPGNDESHFRDTPLAEEKKEGGSQAPAGFIVLRAADDEGEILSLGVSPQWRRRGLASLLLREGLREAAGRGAIAVYLEVDRDNAPARAFYSASGFVETGVRKGYYPRDFAPAADAIVMRYPLGLEWP